MHGDKLLKAIAEIMGRKEFEGTQEAIGFADAVLPTFYNDKMVQVFRNFVLTEEMSGFNTKYHVRIGWVITRLRNLVGYCEKKSLKYFFNFVSDVTIDHN